MSHAPEKYFDAHLVGLSETRPAALSGGVVYDAPDMLPAGFFRAQRLAVRVGPEDERYPSGVDVIDLQIPESELFAMLHEPREKWFSLCRAQLKKNVIHLNLPPNASIAKSVARLAQSFPQTQFIVDPFVHGANAGWQAQVCLGEEENIWLSARGLRSWADGTAADALYFLIGEVGAGKLLFGSGSEDFSPQNWLHQFSFLDDAQRRLILIENARQLFSF